MFNLLLNDDERWIFRYQFFSQSFFGKTRAEWEVMVTGGGEENRRSFSGRLLDWGNSSGVTMFWGVVGCVSSFMCPLFWHVGEGKAVGELGLARLMAMVLCCIATAAVYRTAIVHRRHRFLRKKLPLVGEVLVVLTSGFSIAIGNATLTYADNWGGVVDGCCCVLLFSGRGRWPNQFTASICAFSSGLRQLWQPFVSTAGTFYLAGQW